MNVDLITSAFLQGMMLSLITYGVMIPFRLLNFSDLTSEGAYPFAATLFTLLSLAGCPIWISTLLAACGAGCLGLATAWIHLKLNVNTLLSGIIVSIMVYSINLRFLGKPNVALFGQSFWLTGELLHDLIIVIAVVSLSLLPLILFLKTDYGLIFRAVGFNPLFVKHQQFSVSRYTFLGLFLGSFFTGITATLIVQQQQYVDVGMGVGIVIHALAALMLGEVLVGEYSLLHVLIAPLIGAIVYQQIQAIVLNLGLEPSDLKCFTGMFLLCIIALRQKKQHAFKRSLKIPADAP